MLRLPPRRPVGAEDIRHLQGATPHGAQAYEWGRFSSGLVTWRKSSVATWV